MDPQGKLNKDEKLEALIRRLRCKRQAGRPGCGLNLETPLESMNKVHDEKESDSQGKLNRNEKLEALFRRSRCKRQAGRPDCSGLNLKTPLESMNKARDEEELDSQGKLNLDEKLEALFRRSRCKRQAGRPGCGLNLETPLESMNKVHDEKESDSQGKLNRNEKLEALFRRSRCKRQAGRPDCSGLNLKTPLQSMNKARDEEELGSQGKLNLDEKLEALFRRSRCKRQAGRPGCGLNLETPLESINKVHDEKESDSQGKLNRNEKLEALFRRSRCKRQAGRPDCSGLNLKTPLESMNKARDEEELDSQGKLNLDEKLEALK